MKTPSLAEIGILQEISRDKASSAETRAAHYHGRPVPMSFGNLWRESEKYEPITLIIPYYESTHPLDFHTHIFLFCFMFAGCWGVASSGNACCTSGRSNISWGLL